MVQPKPENEVLAKRLKTRRDLVDGNWEGEYLPLVVCGGIAH